MAGVPVVVFASRRGPHVVLRDLRAEFWCRCVLDVGAGRELCLYQSRVVIEAIEIIYT